MIRYIAVAAAMLFLTSCTAFQPQARVSPLMELPGKYSLYEPDQPGPGRWWQAFESGELNRLVDEALSKNFDLRTAWARLKQADATLLKTGASLKPSVSYSSGAQKSWLQAKASGTGIEHSDSQEYTAGLGASYEIDLWGRLRASRQSDALELKAAREDLETAAVTVAAQVVSTWIDLLSTRRQTLILNQQIAINEDLLKLQYLRFQNGQADALAVSQQREALAAARARLPMLQLDEQQNLNALAVLLGRTSAQDLSITQENLPGLIPIPAQGLPADLLASRPDIRAAGLRLGSADWQVSAAQADRLPAITLSADAAFSSDSLGLLFNNWLSTLAGSITGPLFDAGYRAAEVTRTRAVADEYLTAYAATVAGAIQEVEDSLVTEKRQSDYILLLQEQLKAARLSLKDARLQYMNGQDNYLSYLTAWTSIQDLERQLVEEQATLIKNRVELHRALGGDWIRDLTDGNFLSGAPQKNTSVTEVTVSSQLQQATQTTKE